MKLVALFFITMIIMITTACFSGRSGSTLPDLNIFDVIVVDATETLPLSENLRFFNLQIKRNDVRLRKFEPVTGVYLGAYIQSDRVVKDNINEFEELIGVHHAIYAYNKAAGADFPFTWVLELAALMKTPLITIHPSDRFAPFDIHLIEQTAKDAGRFNIPMFINLFPVSRNMNYNAIEYVSFFRRARELFSEHAPNAALIWSVHFEDVFSAEQFYPGSDYVDWVGINAFSNIAENNKHTDIMNHISHFYFRFQYSHPIMITQLGVSYFTTNGFTFRTHQAAAEIERIYESITNNLPRIKAIIYASFDQTDFYSGRNLNNYRITGETPLIESYARAVSGERFLSLLEEQMTSNNYVTLKSPFQIVQKNGIFYISENSLIFDLNIKENDKFNGFEKVINDTAHLPFQIVLYYMNMSYILNSQTYTFTITQN